MGQNQPSEPELTIEEREEFFAGQDAITGMFNGVTVGIYVTSIVPPAHGWPVATYCPLCKETTFFLSPWSAKPAKDEYLIVKNICVADEIKIQHNMHIAMKAMYKECFPIPAQENE